MILAVRVPGTKRSGVPENAASGPALRYGPGTHNFRCREVLRPHWESPGCGAATAAESPGSSDLAAASNGGMGKVFSLPGTWGTS